MFHLQSIPLRCAVYATSLGNDTDTIACMACALAGAHVGADLITDAESQGTLHFPTKIMHPCEGLDRVNDYANWLYLHYQDTLEKVASDATVS